MTERYLLTGGAGNLACQLTHVLAADAERIVLFDQAPRPVANPSTGCVYVRGDLTQPDALPALFAAHRPTVVLHLASLLSGTTEQDRPRGWAVNADATFGVLEAALAGGVRTVFFPSSLAAYGGSLPDPLPEDHPQWPTSLYGVTKAAAERLGVYYHERHGLDFRYLRLPVVISPHAPAGAASGYSSRAFVEAAQTGRFVFPVKPATRVSTVYVRDALAGIAALLRAPAAALTQRVYNIHGVAPAAGEIAAAIQARLPQAALRFEPDPALVALIDSWPAQIIDRSARRDWGWQPTWTLDRLADDLLSGDACDTGRIRPLSAAG